MLLQPSDCRFFVGCEPLQEASQRSTTHKVSIASAVFVCVVLILSSGEEQTLSTAV